MISPLSVAENSEKLRLILDLRYLNSFLSLPKFKYEDVCSIRNLFNKGDFFFTFFKSTKLTTRILPQVFLGQRITVAHTGQTHFNSKTLFIV